jgi:hypothetical protein
MKRLMVGGLAVIAAILLGAFVINYSSFLVSLRSGGGSLGQSNMTQNLDPRGLTLQEGNEFLPLVCIGASDATSASSESGENYQYHCNNLLSYPSLDSLSGDYELTLTSISYGHFTNIGTEQAYVSYLGNFEDHADNWGGGILFEKEASGWSLIRWYPGGQMDNCLMLRPGGQAKLLCLFGWSGQGEKDTSLWVVTIPPSYDPDADSSPYQTSVIKASDERNTGSPNSNCADRKSPNQAILLSIDNIARSPDHSVFAEAGVTYFAADEAKTACAKADLEDATLSSGTLRLKWDGRSVTVAQGINFAPADW